MDEKMLPEELWGLWCPVIGWKGAASGLYLRGYPSSEFAETDNSSEGGGRYGTPTLVGVHPRNLARADQAEAKVAELRDEIDRLKEEACRFYRADGTFEVMSTPEEAVKARIACAQMIQQFQADNQPRS